MSKDNKKFTPLDGADGMKYFIYCSDNFLDQGVYYDWLRKKFYNHEFANLGLDCNNLESILTDIQDTVAYIESFFRNIPLKYIEASFMIGNQSFMKIFFDKKMEVDPYILTERRCIGLQYFLDCMDYFIENEIYEDIDRYIPIYAGTVYSVCVRSKKLILEIEMSVTQFTDMLKIFSVRARTRGNGGIAVNIKRMIIA